MELQDLLIGLVVMGITELSKRWNVSNPLYLAAGLCILICMPYYYLTTKNIITPEVLASLSAAFACAVTGYQLLKPYLKK